MSLPLAKATEERCGRNCSWLGLHGKCKNTVNQVFCQLRPSSVYSWPLATEPGALTAGEAGEPFSGDSAGQQERVYRPAPPIHLCSLSPRPLRVVCSKSRRLGCAQQPCPPGPIRRLRADLITGWEEAAPSRPRDLGDPWLASQLSRRHPFPDGGERRLSLHSSPLHPQKTLLPRSSGASTVLTPDGPVSFPGPFPAPPEKAPRPDQRSCWPWTKVPGCL